MKEKKVPRPITQFVVLSSPDDYQDWMTINATDVLVNHTTHHSDGRVSVAYISVWA